MLAFDRGIGHLGRRPERVCFSTGPTTRMNIRRIRSNSIAVLVAALVVLLTGVYTGNGGFQLAGGLMLLGGLALALGQAGRRGPPG